MGEETQHEERTGFGRTLGDDHKVTQSNSQNRTYCTQTGFRGSDTGAQTDLAVSQSPFSTPQTTIRLLCVSVPCTSPFYKSMLLYSFQFPVTDLSGMSRLLPDAKLRFSICDMYEDRGGLLHFKYN